jgi:hypothetical protein
VPGVTNCSRDLGACTGGSRQHPLVTTGCARQRKGTVDGSLKGEQVVKVIDGASLISGVLYEPRASIRLHRSMLQIRQTTMEATGIFRLALKWAITSLVLADPARPQVATAAAAVCKDVDGPSSNTRLREIRRARLSLWHLMR